MSTWLITHPLFLKHDTGPGHPERVARLEAILKALEDREFAGVTRVEAEPASRGEIARMHPDSYVDHIFSRIPDDGPVPLDADTMVSRHSGEAAVHAAGALVQAVDAVMSNQTKRAFCAVRPPGHHAEPGHAMGFCLFNNIAIGAAHARAIHHVKRIAIVDFDVHHGNGTQAMLGAREGFLYCSTHQAPLFPGTGHRSDNREDHVLNVPLPPGSGSEAFRSAYEDEVLPAIDHFEPELIMVSAGFDAHQNDPLAGLRLADADYAWISQALVDAANRHCEGRLISCLEGGYDLEALAAGAAAHMRALMS